MSNVSSAFALIGDTFPSKNWSSEVLVFEERTRRKTFRSREENQQQTQPTYDAASGKRTRDTMVGGQRSHYCAIPAPQICKL